MRRLQRLFIILIVLLILIGAVFWFFRVRAAEYILSNQFKKPVTVKNVHFGWSSLTVDQLTMESDGAPLLTFSKLTLFFTIKELLSSPHHIQRIKIEDPWIGIQWKNSSGSDNNWAPLLNEIPSTPSPSEKKQPSFKIDLISLVNLQIDIKRASGKSVPVPAIPYLEFENLNGTGSEIGLQILRQTFIKVLQSLPSKLPLDPLLESLSQKPLTPEEQSTVDNVKKALKGSVETLQRKTSEVKNYLNDLFSK